MESLDSRRLAGLAARLDAMLDQQAERRAPGAPLLHARVAAHLERALRQADALEADADWAAKEPDALEGIRRTRPRGPRRLWAAVDRRVYADRVAGALRGRIAGCVLGAPVELWDVERMAAQARGNGDAFPPVDYWSNVAEPWTLHYETSPRRAYLRRDIDGAPVDDDLMYTVLGLLVLEAAGPEFTTGDVAAQWLRQLPHACTAEEVALANLRAGVPADRAAEPCNPYQHWIGAAIRADPWGYAAPGWPERAAEYAWRDARLSHRRAGVHGAMFFAAAIAAAFATGDPVAALRVGLTEIPRDCDLARAVRWALRTAPTLADFRAARAAVDRKFPAMDPVHTINNACLVVFGLHLGGRNFTRVIGETVAMGLDNDCTAATAGSLFGAAYGRSAVPTRWWRPFGNRLHSYLKEHPQFALDDLCRRFGRQALRTHNGSVRSIHAT